MVTYAEVDRLPIPKWVEYHQLLSMEEILNQERIFQKDSQEWIHKLYGEFEKNNIEQIAFLGEEIGLMLKLKEKFKNDQVILGHCRYFIDLCIIEIEELYGEIEEYREFIKGLKKLPG